MGDVTVRMAAENDLTDVAGLRWRWTRENGETAGADRTEFTENFVRWALRNSATHHCVIATRGAAVLGMAWLGVLSRVPTPQSPERATGDVQSVYVVPEERSAGLGSAMIDALLEKARELGLERVTVHSSSRAIPTYQRRGFDYAKRLLQVDAAQLDGARSPRDP